MDPLTTRIDERSKLEREFGRGFSMEELGGPNSAIYQQRVLNDIASWNDIRRQNQEMYGDANIKPIDTVGKVPFTKKRMWDGADGRGRYTNPSATDWGLFMVRDAARNEANQLRPNFKQQQMLQNTANSVSAPAQTSGSQPTINYPGRPGKRRSRRRTMLDLVNP